MCTWMRRLRDLTTKISPVTCNYMNPFSHATAKQTLSLPVRCRSDARFGALQEQQRIRHVTAPTYVFGQFVISYAMETCELEIITTTGRHPLII